MDPERKRKALALDLDKIAVCYPPFPKAAERSSFLAFQEESSRLSKILSEELACEEPLPDIEEIIRFTPSPQRDDPEPQPESQPQQDDDSITL